MIPGSIIFHIVGIDLPHDTNNYQLSKNLSAIVYMDYKRYIIEFVGQKYDNLSEGIHHSNLFSILQYICHKFSLSGLHN